MAKTPWTDDRVALLKKLWGEGFSASQIAAEIGGCTRNAAIGKIHRLELSLSHSPRTSRAPGARTNRTPKPTTSLRGHTIKSLAERTAQRRTEIAAFKARAVEEAEAATSAHPVTFAELQQQHCKWPLGDPQDRDNFRFCGDERREGFPYCGQHCAIAYDDPALRYAEKLRRRSSPTAAKAAVAASQEAA
jgi:GcrA cell cycle regulator